MMSNLYLLNEQIIRTIKEYRIKVTTSLDGDKVCNDENRIDILGNGTFEQVSRNIKKLQEITGEPSAIEATLSGIHNKTSVSRFDVVDFLGSQFDVKFCSAIEVCDFNESGVEVFRENHMLNEQIREEIQLYIQKGVVTDKVKDFFSVIHGIFENDYWCDAGITQFSIMPNGDIYPCQLFAAEERKKCCMGNILDIERSEKFFKINEKLCSRCKSKTPRCISCNYKNYCSTCLAQRYIAEKIECFDSAMCEKLKTYINLLIEEYADMRSDKQKWTILMERMKEDRKAWELLLG